ncbi:heat shock 70 kDa protein-like [Zophobas morio]|uniref:heat shock 70 kDa protein-like n=1 Tax=Zophobas morio TaxID=2755281 RepID=UPI003083AB4C
MTHMLPPNGIYGIKRFVGKHFKTIEEILKYLSFDVENRSDRPVIKIERDNGTLELSPQQISSLILKKIKTDVEAKLGDKVDKAVIAIPAYFNTTQREKTLKAANEVGFTVLKLFNGSTAAALSYYFKNDDETECYALVYDLGGGTFDVSILKRTATNIDVICVDGDTQLGGKDFDNLIVDYVCEKTKQHDWNPKEDRTKMHRLQNICENAKITLSLDKETSISLEEFMTNDETIEIELRRDEFVLRAKHLIERTINIVDRCLKNSKIPKDQIDHVILSGGSSRIPKIQEELSKYFDGKTLSEFTNLEECVAEGAALQAAMLANNNTQKINKLVMTDVVPLSLGVELCADRMHFVIKKGAPIPTSNSINVSTTRDQQKTVPFKIFEGERLNVKKNHYLGSLLLENITPAPPGESKEEMRNNMKELTVEYTRGGRSDGEIKDVIIDAEKNKEEDELFDVFSKRKLYLLEYCEAVKYNLRILNLIGKYQDIYALCKEVQTRCEDIDVDNSGELDTLIDKTKRRCATCNNEELTPIRVRNVESVVKRRCHICPKTRDRKQKQVLDKMYATNIF